MLNINKGISIFSRYKTSFYQKSLTLKTDFSRSRTQYKIWHPRYFDVHRHTQYQKEKRDYNKLAFNTQDQLHFDHDRSEINGGFKLLYEHLKKDGHEAEYSVHRISYILYNMVISNINDIEFFDELDSQINLTIVNSNPLYIRSIYGILYAYYKLSRGKAENIYYFEKCIEAEPNMMHIEMSLPLFELANKTTIIDKDRLNTNFHAFYKPNFLDNWEQVKYKQRIAAEFFRIFSEHKVVDEDIWNKLIKTTFDFGRIQNIENYDTMLRGLIWYNTYPESPKYGKLTKQIEDFKAPIKKNENRSWKYDVEVKILI